MNVYALSETQILIFALVLLRMTGFIFSSAIFSLPSINVPTKILFALVMATLLYPTVPANPILAAGFGETLPLLAAREVLIGMTLGFLTRLFFFAVSMTGEITSVSLGLGSAQMFNPMIGSHAGVIEQLYQILGVLFFLLINGHHILLSALAQSLSTVPVGTMSLNVGAYGEVVAFMQDLLVLTLKMSAPIVVSLFITNVAMGILGRAIPQMNVLVTSFPVTMMLGLAVLVVCMPLFVYEMNGLTDLTASKLMAVLKAL